MLTCEFLGARHGDCILVRWPGNKLILVDGGPDPVYKERLRPHLLALPHGAGQPLDIEVVCVTHVDEDHIVGVLKLLQELRRSRRDQLLEPFRIKRLWFNAVEELVEITAPGLPASVQTIVEKAGADAAFGASYQQGRGVRNDAAALGLGGNPPFGGAITTGAKADIGGLVITVVAPDQTAMNLLAAKWRAAKRRKDPAVIAQAYADDSVPNLSSLAMHLQHGTSTVLLTGDARGDHLLKGLEAAGTLLPKQALHVGLLQLPHHGSENNVASGFFERVTADHYVVSADGIKHHHPSEPVLRWLVESRDPNDTYTIHLTNDIPFARAELQALQNGRQFAINVRPASQRAITVNIPTK